MFFNGESPLFSRRFRGFSHGFGFVASDIYNIID
jgi:hypothetical protein